MTRSTRSNLLVLFLLGLLSTSSFGVIVTLQSGFVGDITTSAGADVSNSLIRVGRLTGTPTGSSVAEISAVFQELGDFNTGSSGRPDGTVSESASSASSFNNQVIYYWAFDTASAATATEHALFTNPSATPSAGDTWVFPVHTGAGTDAVTLSGVSLVADGDFSLTAGALAESSGPGSARIVLTPIPEPSAPILLTLVGVTAVFYRRR